MCDNPLLTLWLVCADRVAKLAYSTDFGVWRRDWYASDTFACNGTERWGIRYGASVDGVASVGCLLRADHTTDSTGIWRSCLELSSKPFLSELQASNP